MRRLLMLRVRRRLLLVRRTHTHTWRCFELLHSTRRAALWWRRFTAVLAGVGTLVRHRRAGAKLLLRGWLLLRRRLHSRRRLGSAAPFDKVTIRLGVFFSFVLGE
jgi:hypothetical protein